METIQTEKERELWRTAKKRVGFRRHLTSYFVINAMFWFIWYFTDGKDGVTEFPWPVWPMLGWGIGLLFDFLGTYVYPKSGAVEREYEKLKNRQS